MEVIAIVSDYVLCTLILTECCPIYTPMREFPQYTPMREDTHTHVSYNGYTWTLIMVTHPNVRWVQFVEPTR